MHKHNPYALLISRDLTPEKLGFIAADFKAGHEKLSKAATLLPAVEDAFRNLRVMRCRLTPTASK